MGDESGQREGAEAPAGAEVEGVADDGADDVDDVGRRGGEPDGAGTFARRVGLPDALDLAGAGLDAKNAIAGGAIDDTAGADAQRKISVPRKRTESSGSHVEATTVRLAGSISARRGRISGAPEVRMWSPRPMSA